MTSDAVVLTPTETMLTSSIVGQTINQLRLQVVAATFQPTHLHLVFAPTDQPIKEVITTLKYRSARAIQKLRENTRKRASRSIWTKGQFVTYIKSVDHLHNAITYVQQHNLRCGRDATPYDWIAPTDTPREPARDGSAM